MPNMGHPLIQMNLLVIFDATGLEYASKVIPKPNIGNHIPTFQNIKKSVTPTPLEFFSFA